MAPPIRATFGRRGFGSFESAALSLCLVNKLRARTDLDGSTVFRLIWKERPTPSGRLISALRASARSTSDSGSGSWPTPDAQKTSSAKGLGDRPSRKATNRTTGYLAEAVVSYASWPTPNTPLGGRVLSVEATISMKSKTGRKVQVGLENIAQLASWPTPKQSDCDKGVRTLRGAMKELDRKGPGSDLPTMAAAAGWRTPRGEISGDTAESHEARQTRVVTKHGRRMGTPLEVQAQWATPAARDYRTANGRSYAARGGGRKGEQLPNQVVHSGPIATGSLVSMAKRGQLNPAHSRWLMGYPGEWDACAVTAMRSIPKQRKCSSKRISTPAQE